MTDIKFSKLIAHRGASGLVPENTLIAFQKAKEAGVNWVEFDVQLSADSVPVVIHDASVDRTTDGHGSIDSFKLNELKRLNVGSYQSPALKGEKIPTLEETLQYLIQNQMHANIELKSTRNCLEEDVQLVDAVSQVCQPYLARESQLIFSSLSPYVLAFLRRKLPATPLGLVATLGGEGDHFSHELAHLKQVIDYLDCYSLHVNESIVNIETFQELKAICPHVLCWTVNSLERAEVLLKLGVESLFTDDVTLESILS